MNTNLKFTLKGRRPCRHVAPAHGHSIQPVVHLPADRNRPGLAQSSRREYDDAYSFRAVRLPAYDPLTRRMESIAFFVLAIIGVALISVALWNPAEFRGANAAQQVTGSGSTNASRSPVSFQQRPVVDSLLPTRSRVASKLWQ